MYGHLQRIYLFVTDIDSNWSTELKIWYCFRITNDWLAFVLNFNRACKRAQYVNRIAFGDTINFTFKSLHTSIRKTGFGRILPDYCHKLPIPEYTEITRRERFRLTLFIRCNKIDHLYFISFHEFWKCEWIANYFFRLFRFPIDTCNILRKSNLKIRAHANCSIYKCDFRW